MAKWFGTIGYAKQVETEPGYWEEKITKRLYYGDIIRNTRALQNTSQINDDVNIGNQISILADPYAVNHIYAMRCIEFQGADWTVSHVDVQYPRLILSIGGLYKDGK